MTNTEYICSDAARRASAADMAADLGELRGKLEAGKGGAAAASSARKALARLKRPVSKAFSAFSR